MEPAERRGAEGRGRDRRRPPTPFRGAVFITLAQEPAGTARPASPFCPFESPAPICRVLEVAELEAAGGGEGICPPLLILMVTRPGRSGGGLFPQQPPLLLSFPTPCPQISLGSTALSGGAWALAANASGKRERGMQESHANKTQARFTESTSREPRSMSGWGLCSERWPPALLCEGRGVQAASRAGPDRALKAAASPAQLCPRPLTGSTHPEPEEASLELARSHPFCWQMVKLRLRGFS